MPVIDPKYRDSVATFASPEAIAAHLAKARAALRRAEREVEWLEALQTKRAAQVEAGLWPSAAKQEEVTP